MTLTAERLREFLSYDPETGVFVWIKARRGTGRGDVAGTTRRDGYVSIVIDQRSYLAHRLAWLYVTGEWPPYEIDHKDRDTGNNRIGNLRVATRAENNRNGPRRRHNRCPWKGVRQSHHRTDRWTARIVVDRVEKHIGTYDCPVAAHFAYALASARYHREFGRAS